VSWRTEQGKTGFFDARQRGVGFLLSLGASLGDQPGCVGRRREVQLDPKGGSKRGREGLHWSEKGTGSKVGISCGLLRCVGRDHGGARGLTRLCTY